MCTALPRKEYDAEFKTRVVTACQQAGALIAGIALARSSSPFFPSDLSETLAITGFQRFFSVFQPTKRSH